MGILSPSDWTNAIDPGPGEGMTWDQALTMALQKDQQDKIYNQQRADLAPFLGLGQWGAGEMQNLLQKGYDVNTDPNYKFAKSEIDRNVGRQLNAMGRKNSSYGMGALGRAYGDLAQKSYNDRYSKLMGATNIGQGTASSGNGLASSQAQGSNSIYSDMLNQANLNNFNSQQAGWNKAAAATGGLGTAANIYSLGQNAGWWGNSSPWDSYDWGAADASSWNGAGTGVGDAGGIGSAGYSGAYDWLSSLFA